MELANGLSPRHPSSNRDKNEETDLQIFELETVTTRPDHHDFHSMSALEILRESVRILRFNSTGFMAIAAVLICPVSAVILSNLLVEQSLVNRLTLRLMLLAKSTGLPLRPFIKHSSHKFSELVVSAAMCFPLFLTLSLLSRVAVVYSVDCTYSRIKFDSSKCYEFIVKIWKRVVLTYLCACAVITACFILSLVLLVLVSTVYSMMGFPPSLFLYPAVVAGLMFSVILANAVIICNLAVVISVLEEVSGLQALARSNSLIQGQTHVGLWMFLGSMIGMAFVETLFDHRVKTISYGDGSSRLWEGPLLVVMYSFVVLIDCIMNAVFYFSCKSYQMEESTDDVESEPLTSSSQ